MRLWNAIRPEVKATILTIIFVIWFSIFAVACFLQDLNMALVAAIPAIMALVACLIIGVWRMFYLTITGQLD